MRWMIALLVVGCSTSHGVDPGAQAFIEALDEVLCEREMRCEAQVYLAARFHCHPSTGPYWAGAPRATANGDLIFDATAADMCLAELEAMPCHLDMDPATSCGDVFVRMRELGERCTPTPSGWTGCVYPAFCATSDGVRGTCAPGGAPGETCDARPCASTHCNLFSRDAPPVCTGLGEGDACTGSCGELACIDGRCTALPIHAVGEACGPGVADCAEDAQCVESVCVAVGSATIDEPCLDRQTCTADLWCNQSGRCAARLPPGAPCTSGLQCSAEARYCTRGACSTESLPLAPSCLYSGLWPGSLPCSDPELSCNAIELECQPVVALGAACDSYTEVCEEGARCEGDRCIAIVSVGAACGDDAVCAWNLECRGGRCEPIPFAGEACTGNCLTGDCIGGVCTGRTGGAACERAAQCESGECRAGMCRPVSGEGGPCGTIAGRCATGLRCFPDVDDVGRCFPAPRP